MGNLIRSIIHAIGFLQTQAALWRRLGKINGVLEPEIVAFASDFPGFRSLFP